MLLRAFFFCLLVARLSFEQRVLTSRRGDEGNFLKRRQSAPYTCKTCCVARASIGGTRKFQFLQYFAYAWAVPVGSDTNTSVWKRALSTRVGTQGKGTSVGTFTFCEPGTCGRVGTHVVYKQGKQNVSPHNPRRFVRLRWLPRWFNALLISPAQSFCTFACWIALCRVTMLSFCSRPSSHFVRLGSLSLWRGTCSFSQILSKRFL